MLQTAVWVPSPPRSDASTPLRIRVRSQPERGPKALPLASVLSKDSSARYPRALGQLCLRVLHLSGDKHEHSASVGSCTYYRVASLRARVPSKQHHLDHPLQAQANWRRTAGLPRHEQRRRLLLERTLPPSQTHRLLLHPRHLH